MASQITKEALSNPVFAKSFQTALQSGATPQEAFETAREAENTARVQAQEQANLAKRDQAVSTTIGGSYTNPERTKEKIRTLNRKNPPLAAFAANFFGLFVDGVNTADAAAGSINNQLQSLDSYSRNLFLTLFSVELQSQQTTTNIATNISGAVRDFTADVVRESQELKQDLKKQLQPVSTNVGQTLVNLTNVLRDPIGAPFAIAQTIAKMIDNVNPDFTNNLDATLKKFNVDELANLPSQVYGGLRSLISLVDAVLALPFIILEDLYNGLMEIMEAISELIDALIASVLDFIIGPDGLLDNLFGIAEILDFLQAVGEFTSIVGGITGAFTGANAINQTLVQVNNFSAQATTFITNPAQLARAYIPTEVNQTLGALRNPDQVLDQMIPVELKNQLANIGRLPGLGFVGNMGYGVQESLAALKGGLLSRITDQFENQLGVISPTLNLRGPDPLTNTQQPAPADIEASAVTGQPSVKGVPQKLEPSSPVLPEK